MTKDHKGKINIYKTYHLCTEVTSFGETISEETSLVSKNRTNSFEQVYDGL